MLREWKLVQRFTFCLNENLYNLAILTLQFDDITVKTIYRESTTSSKERQGQTLGVRFSELSVIESTKRY